MTITQDDFTWIFKDPNWKNKFLTGSLLAFAGFVPVLGLVGLVIDYGYALLLMRTVMRGKPRVLPEWDDYGALFVDGVKAMLSAVGYSLPAMFLLVCGSLFLWATIFGGAMLQPNQGSGDRDGAFVFFLLIGQLGIFACIGIGMLLYLIGFFFTPVAVGQYARTGEISAGYRWSEVSSVLRANLSGFILALVIYAAVAFGLGFVVSILYYTIILCVLIPFLTAPITFYTTLMFAQFFGAAYREGALKAGLLAA